MDTLFANRAETLAVTIQSFSEFKLFGACLVFLLNVLDTLIAVEVRVHRTRDQSVYLRHIENS